MYPVPALPRRAGRRPATPRPPAALAAMLALLAALLLAPAAARAQAQPEFFERPFANKQWTFGRRLDQSELRYCVDPRDSDWEVAGEIADAIARGLLLAPKRHVVESRIVIADITKVYGVMRRYCDLYMGFKLIPGAYADWATVTRAYYTSGYDYVAADPALASLADLPPGRPVAVTIGTQAHFRLVSYVTALPAAKRWPIFPMGTNDLALKALLDGTADAALVWAPSLWEKQRDDPAYAGLRVIDPAPLPPTRLGVGALMLSNESFLRTAVDEAIDALARDGTIAGILEAHGFPATAGS